MPAPERTLLLKTLDEKLLSCQNQDAQVNITLLARKLGRTREHLAQMLHNEQISPALAWHLINKFGDHKKGTKELKISDIAVFVRSGG